MLKSTKSILANNSHGQKYISEQLLRICYDSYNASKCFCSAKINAVSVVSSIHPQLYELGAQCDLNKHSMLQTKC